MVENRRKEGRGVRGSLVGSQYVLDLPALQAADTHVRASGATVVETDDALYSAVAVTALLDGGASGSYWATKADDQRQTQHHPYRELSGVQGSTPTD